ncbi:MAG TPA: Uma2 family endonuclease [Pyrinomonadaceae bacterium]
MSTTSTAIMTAEELMELPDDGFRYELINGELQKMPPPGLPHGRIALRLCVYLGQFVLDHGLGEAFATDTGFKLTSNPDTVLAPDLAFVTNERFAELSKTEGYGAGAPDLAVEVLSPSDRPGKVNKKISRWFSFGTKQVWIVDPKHCTVTVYRSTIDTTTFSGSDYLESQDLLPGFRISLEKIFGSSTNG